MSRNKIKFFISLIFGVIFFGQQQSFDGVECYDCEMGIYDEEVNSGPCLKVTSETRTQKDCTACDIQITNNTDECWFCFII
jgi:hypothetical protein